MLLKAVPQREVEGLIWRMSDPEPLKGEATENFGVPSGLQSLFEKEGVGFKLLNELAAELEKYEPREYSDKKLKTPWGLEEELEKSTNNNADDNTVSLFDFLWSPWYKEDSSLPNKKFGLKQGTWYDYAYREKANVNNHTEEELIKEFTNTKVARHFSAFIEKILDIPQVSSLGEDSLTSFPRELANAFGIPSYLQKNFGILWIYATVLDGCPKKAGEKVQSGTCSQATFPGNIYKFEKQSGPKDLYNPIKRPWYQTVNFNHSDCGWSAPYEDSAIDINEVGYLRTYTCKYSHKHDSEDFTFFISLDFIHYPQSLKIPGVDVLREKSYLSISLFIFINIFLFSIFVSIRGRNINKCVYISWCQRSHIPDWGNIKNEIVKAELHTKEFVVELAGQSLPWPLSKLLPVGKTLRKTYSETEGKTITLQHDFDTIDKRIWEFDISLFEYEQTRLCCFGLNFYFNRCVASPKKRTVSLAVGTFKPIIREKDRLLGVIFEKIQQAEPELLIQPKGHLYIERLKGRNKPFDDRFNRREVFRRLISEMRPFYEGGGQVFAAILWWDFAHILTASKAMLSTGQNLQRVIICRYQSELENYVRERLQDSQWKELLWLAASDNKIAGELFITTLKDHPEKQELWDMHDNLDFNLVGVVGPYASSVVVAQRYEIRHILTEKGFPYGGGDSVIEGYKTDDPREIAYYMKVYKLLRKDDIPLKDFLIQKFPEHFSELAIAKTVEGEVEEP